MAFELDKEMDFLLRQAAQDKSFASGSWAATDHLDADELATFAENALPETMRVRFVAHLADCNDCREVLASLILLNEIETEEQATQPVAVTQTVQTPWFEAVRRWFALPTLGYATAALAILLVGTFAFVALRPKNESQSVAVVVPIEDEKPDDEEKRKRRAPAPAVAQVEEPENMSLSEEAPQPTPENTNTEILAQSTPTAEVGAEENLPPSVRATRGITTSSNRNQNQPTTVARNPTNSSPNLNPTNAASSPPEQTTVAAAAPSQPKPQISPLPIEDEDKAITSAVAGAQRSESANEQSDQAAKPSADSSGISAPSSRAKTAARESTRLSAQIVNGKTFQKVGGVWVDQSYNSQNAQNVRRDSDEYKKLDAGLRSIADQLGGAVIVVWQGKAYKIR